MNSNPFYQPPREVFKEQKGRTYPTDLGPTKLEDLPAIFLPIKEDFKDLISKSFTNRWFDLSVPFEQLWEATFPEIAYYMDTKVTAIFNGVKPEDLEDSLKRTTIFHTFKLEFTPQYQTEENLLAIIFTICVCKEDIFHTTQEDKLIMRINKYQRTVPLES